MKLKEYKKVTGKIRVITGLHIGAGAERMEIGGNDNPVIKNPVTEKPYIPGSSLKGKIRALLELKYNKVEPNGDPHKWCQDKDCPICRLFGTSSGDSAQLGPSRIIFRDAFVTKEWEEKGIVLTEDKIENSLNRITARPNPRPVERVIPEVQFDFELVYRVFENEDGMNQSDEELFDYVLEGMKLLEQDALGGGGSRGNGKIEFIDLKDEKGNSLTL